MSAVRFASKVQEDGSLVVPRETVDQLGALPGEEVRGTIETTNGNRTSAKPDTLDTVLKELLEEADRIELKPGKESDDPYERAVGEIIKGKYRRMGFDL